MNYRSQTATEYLILIAVVIIIALIVISVLGGIPSIGGGAGSAASEARLKSLGIGVESYAFSNESGVMILKNNKADSVSVSAVYVDGKECGYGTFVLRAGQSRKINCSNITNIGSNYEYSISMNWTDVLSGAKYVDEPDVKITGDVVSGLNTDVGSSGSSGGGGSGGSSPAQCDDGIDNDGDGYTDMADPSCSSDTDDDESPYDPLYLLEFVSPSIANGGSATANNFLMNVSVPQSEDLVTLDYEWDGTNYSVYDSSLVLMMDFDDYSKLNDMSLRKNNASNNGATWVFPGKYSGAYDFDGTNDHISIPSTSDHDFGTDDFTIEFWMNSDDVSQWKCPLTSTATYETLGYLFSMSGGTIGFTQYTNGPDTGLVGTGAILNSNYWHHILLTREDTSADGLKLYVDGVLKDSGSGNYNLNTDAPELRVGTYYTGQDNIRNFDGEIDELKIWNRSFSAAEVSLAYQSNFRKLNDSGWTFLVDKNESTASHDYKVYTSYSDASVNSSSSRSVNVFGNSLVSFVGDTPANGAGGLTSVLVNTSIVESDLQSFSFNWNGTEYSVYDSSLVFMMNFDVYAPLMDTSLYDNDGVASGGAAFTASGKYNGGYSFDGNDDYVTIEASSALDFRNKDFTVSFWLYPNGYNSQGSMFNVFMGDGEISASGNQRTWGFGTESNNYLYFGVSEEWTIYSQDIRGGWMHIVGTQDTVNNVLKLYINGVEEEQTATTRELEYASQITLGYDTSASRNANCIIDELMIWNRTLGAAEIATMYNTSLNWHSSNQWYFNVSKIGLPADSYTFNASVSDVYGNSNSSSVRTVTVT